MKLTKLISEIPAAISDWAENLSPEIKVKLNDANHIF